MESLTINIEEIDKLIADSEELVKKYPNCTARKICLESMKQLRAEAMEELERRKCNGI